jgi:hypothetical protein
MGMSEVGASCRRKAVAFSVLRSISSSLSATPNRIVSSAVPPSRSSSRTTVILVAVVASMPLLGYLRGTDQLSL